MGNPLVSRIPRVQPFYRKCTIIIACLECRYFSTWSLWNVCDFEYQWLKFSICTINLTCISSEINSMFSLDKYVFLLTNDMDFNLVYMWNTLWKYVFLQYIFNLPVDTCRIRQLNIDLTNRHTVDRPTIRLYNFYNFFPMIFEIIKCSNTYHTSTYISIGRKANLCRFRLLLQGKAPLWTTLRQWGGYKKRCENTRHGKIGTTVKFIGFPLISRYVYISFWEIRWGVILLCVLINTL